MPDFVGKEGIRAARVTDLFAFLLSEHPNDVVREGSDLRLASNHSIAIHSGHTGYQDFANGETGNSIELLTRHLGYGFQEAVRALCGFTGTDPEAQPSSIDLAHPEGPQFDPAAGTWAWADGSPCTTPPARAPVTPPALTAAAGAKTRTDSPPRVFRPPDRFDGPYHALFAYLNRTRGIPVHVIQRLVGMGVLYQEGDSGHNNIVFINPEKTFYEVRGTYSDVPFHQVQFSAPDAFWWFKPRDPYDEPLRAYVCESSIDAISLYLMLAMDQANWAERCLYCSIGGVANQNRIDVIRAGMAAAGCRTILAVDRDDAGKRCRERNPLCDSTIPRLKDWNEDLLAYQREYHGGQVQEWIGQLPHR